MRLSLLQYGMTKLNKLMLHEKSRYFALLANIFGQSNQRSLYIDILVTD